VLLLLELITFKKPWNSCVTQHFLALQQALHTYFYMFRYSCSTLATPGQRHECCLLFPTRPSSPQGGPAEKLKKLIQKQPLQEDGVRDAVSSARQRGNPYTVGRWHSCSVAGQQYKDLLWVCLQLKLIKACSTDEFAALGLQPPSLPAPAAALHDSLLAVAARLQAVQVR
jgi:hypothetical protein